MPIDLALLAGQVVSFLSPFLPRLLGLGKQAGEKVGDTLVEKGGELAARQAAALWDRVVGRTGDDPEIRATATVVAMDPADSSRRNILAEALCKRLESAPELVDELAALMAQVRTSNVMRGDDESFFVENEQGKADENLMEGGKGTEFIRNKQGIISP